MKPFLITSLGFTLLSTASAFAAPPRSVGTVLVNQRISSYAPAPPVAAGSSDSRRGRVANTYAPFMALNDGSSESSSVFDQITTAIGKSASTLVSASVFLLLAYQRDAVILAIWIGSILNAILSKVAKKVLNHERPAELQNSDRIKLKPSDGGMPSSHAMSLGFISTAVTCGVVPAEYRLVAGLMMAAYSATALRYRVRDHLHTLDQVVVGGLFGVGNAIAWLKLGVGSVGDAGPVLSYAQNHWVSAETGLFPYSALAVPIVLGVLIVGSFERRIALWMENRIKED